MFLHPNLCQKYIDEVAVKKEDTAGKSQQENHRLEESVYRKRYAKVFKI